MELIQNEVYRVRLTDGLGWVNGAYLGTLKGVRHFWVVGIGRIKIKTNKRIHKIIPAKT